MAAFGSALAPKWSQHFTLARASAHAAEMPASVGEHGRRHGAMTTPNIDRIARKGVMISDDDAEPGCTAGRAALTTGR